MGCGSMAMTLEPAIFFKKHALTYPMFAPTVQKRIAGFGQITQDLYGRPIKFPSQIDMPSDEFIWHYCDLESVCGGDFRKFFGKR